MNSNNSDDALSDDAISLTSQDSVDSVDSNVIEEVGKRTELKPFVKTALMRFRCKVQDAILGNYIFGRSPVLLYGFSFRGNGYSPNDGTEVAEDAKDISLWGVPLLPSKGHEGTDTILLKFLQAKDFKVNDAFEMLQKTLQWRKEFKIDGILEETLAPDLGNLVIIDGTTDRKGLPLCFIMYGAMSEKNVFEKAFGSEEKCNEYLRWRVQAMEKCIQNLDFKEGGATSILQISDLKNSRGPRARELRLTAKKAYSTLQENYPGIVFKNIFVNVPLWYYAYHSVCTKFFSQREKRRFIFARSHRVTKTLLKYIIPENIPVQYGGLKRENDDEFTPENRVMETIVKAGCIDSIQVPFHKPGVILVWDLTVLGFDVSYKEEFIPDDDCSYKILIQKERKLSGSVRNSFYISEPGRILLTIDNGSFKRKKVFYRLKIKPVIPNCYHGE